MVTANCLNISQPGVVTFDGTATFFGRTLTPGVGIAITNGDGIAGNPTISLIGNGPAVEHLTGDSGGQLNPDGSNNFNVTGTGSLTVAGSGSTLTPQLTGLTNHTVLVGAGTATITKVGPGSSGQVLQSGGASADPVYSTATYPAVATGTGTILRADGTNWAATTSTYPNTNAVSTLLYASSANVMAALPTANSAILATDSSGVPSITTASGNWLNTTRCAFLAFLGTTDSNVTGDGTVFTIGSGNALTKVFDQGTNLNTNGTFTAPVTGKYFLSVTILVTGGTLISGADLKIVTTARQYRAICSNGPTPAATNVTGNNVTIADMTAGDTATFTINTTDSGGKQDDVIGGASPYLTWISGYLIC